MSRALDYLLKAEHYAQYFRKDANAEARRLYLAAAAEDESFARPCASHAYAVLQAYLYNWYDGSEESAKAEMNSSVSQALSRDPDDLWCHWIDAAVALYSKEFGRAKTRYAEVKDMVESSAIEEDKRSFKVDRADMLLLTGQAGEAIADVNAALGKAAGTIVNVNAAPGTPVPEKYFHWVLGWAYYVNGDYQSSLDALAAYRNPRNSIRKNVIANLVALGNITEAEKQAKKFVEEEAAQGIVYGAPGDPVFPALSLIEDRIPFEDSSQGSLWKSHLGKAFATVVQI